MMTSTSKELSIMKLRRLPTPPTVQNFHLVWLDENINEDKNDDCRNSINKLREIVNTVNTFKDMDDCIDFITDNEQTICLMIVSGKFIETFPSIIQDIPQISSIHIFNHGKLSDKRLTKEWPKISGIYTDITLIKEALRKAASECDKNAVSFNFFKSTGETSNQNLDQLDSSFMYTQILKEILLTIDFDEKHINEFITYCREQYADNNAELKKIDNFEKEYRNY